MQADDAGMQSRRMRNLTDNHDAMRMSHLSKLLAVDIEFNGLIYTLPGAPRDSNAIISGINGQFKSGELTAILGASGAGKSTLLNILAGYKITEFNGTINVNGQPRDIRKFKKMSCYLMQDNLVQPRLTVFEAMSFAVDLKIGKTKSRFEKQIIISNILSVLRLSTNRETITDKLSGGERKRLAIAFELVNNLPVIFLDEPTTGLDEVSSSLCIEILQTLAHFGRTVICSIHTPSASIFQMFDHVYILSGGQCTYRGTASNLMPFLQSINLECPKHYNPADFVVELSSGDYGPDLVELLITAVDTQLPIFPICRTAQASEHEQDDLKVPWSDQFDTLVRRMLLQLYRRKSYMYLRPSLYIFTGLFMGIFYYNMGNDGSKVFSNLCFHLANLVLSLYISMFPSLMQFPLELLLIQREYFNRWYSISVYYWTLTTVTMLIQLLLDAVYLSIIYVMSGQPLEWHRCFMFFAICFICSFIAQTIGYSIAATLNAVNSMFIGAAIGTTMVLLVLQSIGDSSLPIYRKILMRTSYLRYGLEALTTAVYGYDRKNLQCPLEEVYCHFSSPKEIFRNMLGSETIPNFWMNLLGLIIILLICKIMLYYLLRQNLKQRKVFQMFYSIKWFAKQYLNI